MTIQKAYLSSVSLSDYLPNNVFSPFFSLFFFFNKSVISRKERASLVSGLSRFVQDTKNMLILPYCSNDPKKLFALLLNSVPRRRQYCCPFRKLIGSIIKDSHTRLVKNIAP